MEATGAKKPPRWAAWWGEWRAGSAVAEFVSCLAEFFQRVLQRLDQSYRGLWRHLHPVVFDLRLAFSPGCVLQADERLAIHDASADACVLEARCGGHGCYGGMKKASSQRASCEESVHPVPIGKVHGSQDADDGQDRHCSSHGGSLV